MRPVRSAGGGAKRRSTPPRSAPPLRPRPSLVPARAPSSALAAEPQLPPDEWSRLLPGRDPAPPGAPAPQGEDAEPGEGADPAANGKLAAGAGVAAPPLGGHSLGRTARAPRAWLQGTSAGGRGGGRSASCPGQGAERKKAGRGPGLARGCQGRGHRPGRRCQAPGGRAAGAGGPRLLSGFSRRGACRRFLCPSFRFPLARPRHSWREREWGRGSQSGMSLATVAGHPLPAPHSPRCWAGPPDELSGAGPPPPTPGKRNRPGTPGLAGAAALASALLGWLWVGLGTGCQGHYSALGGFAWVLSSAGC